MTPSTKRILFPTLVSLGLLVLALWAPWLTRGAAEQRAVQSFDAAWQGVIDGCGLNCNGCGVKDAQKTWFGYQVQLEYACGMLPEDSPEYHQHSTAFVSFLGTIHGIP
jgi:hypothetical protein